MFCKLCEKPIKGTGKTGMCQSCNKIGGKRSEETKRKMSESATGRIVTEEAKKNMREAWKKRRLIPISDETRMRLSRARSGKGNHRYGKSGWNKGKTKETDASLAKQAEKMSGQDNHMYGKNHSEETKKKISIANTGKNRSEETKEKRSIAMRGEKNPMFGKVGEECPTWKGGISYLRYPREYLKIRKKILRRDNYMCQFCGDRERLSVHHIDSNAFNNNPDNLIVLCFDCHMLGENREARESLALARTPEAVSNF